MPSQENEDDGHDQGPAKGCYNYLADIFPPAEILVMVIKIGHVKNGDIDFKLEMIGEI